MITLRRRNRVHRDTSSVLRHPLFILLAGVAITSVLIPTVNERAARRRITEELRVAKSIEVLQASTETSRRLNLVLTELESFYKDHPGVPSADERSRLAQRVQDLYREFDAKAWWWLPEKHSESMLLGLLPPERIPTTQTLMVKYERNLKDSIAAVDETWYVLVATPYRTDDPRVYRTLRASRRTVSRLRDERDSLVRKIIANMFRSPNLF